MQQLGFTMLRLCYLLVGLFVCLNSADFSEVLSHFYIILSFKSIELVCMDLLRGSYTKRNSRAQKSI